MTAKFKNCKRFNEVGHAHVFTVTVTQNPGSATAAATANVTYTVTPTPGSISSTCGASVPFVGNTATCTITINNPTAGTFTANATASFTVGGVVVTRVTDGTGGDSGPAVKQYVDANIAISPVCGRTHHVFVSIQCQNHQVTLCYLGGVGGRQSASA